MIYMHMGSRVDELQEESEALRRRLVQESFSDQNLPCVDLPHLFDRLQLARDEIFELHEKIKESANESVQVEGDSELSVLRESELQLTAELRFEEYVKWTGYPPDPALLVELLKNHIKESIACHEDELRRKQQNITQLHEEIERLRLVVHQEQHLIRSFTSEAQARVDAQRVGGFSGHYKNATEKLATEKSKRKRVIQQLRSFLDENYQQLDEEVLKTYSRTYGYRLPDPIDRLKSVPAILEILLNQLLMNQNDPWIPIDETFWPPYLELLLRYGIIVYHWDNCNIIRLENV